MFKVLDEKCNPTRATKYSAMVDLYAREDVVIGAGETKIVPLGVKINQDWFPLQYPYDEDNTERCIYDFKISHFLELHPRSSLRAKGLIIGVGVVDLDYPDEIGLIVHNPCKPYTIRVQGIDTTYVNRTATYQINKGDKIAQCTLKEHKGFLLGIESDVERKGGYGSTDK
jgi:dUTPase